MRYVIRELRIYAPVCPLMGVEAGVAPSLKIGGEKASIDMIYHCLLWINTHLAH